MNVYIKKSLWVIFFLVLVLPFLSFAAYPETPDTEPPDNGAMGTAINTGSTAQVKVGGLSVDAFSALLTSYFAQKLGIGTASITATLDVMPTITATSDLKNIKSGLIYNGVSTMANYYGTYIAAPTGSGTITNKYALVTEPSAGKVGIGTVTPTATLSVAGGIQMADDASACTVGKTGTMRWHASALETCNGTAWAPVAPVSNSNTVSCNVGELCGMALWEDDLIWNGARSYRCAMASGPVNDFLNCDGQWHTIISGAPWSNQIYPGITNPWDAFTCDPGFTFKILTSNNAYAQNYPVDGIGSCLKD